MLLDFKQIKK